MSFRIRILSVLLLQALYLPAWCQSDSAKGRKFVVGRIEVSGNYITKTSVVIRELTFKQGDTLNSADWAGIKLRSKNNLLNTSLFNFADIDTVRFPTGEMDITIKVVERWYLWPAPIFHVEERNFNTWWEQDHHRLDKADYGVSLSDYNMFGAKQTLTLIAQFGYTEQFGIGYLIPYLTKKQASGLQFSFSYGQNREIPYTSVNNVLTYLNYPAQIIREQYAGTLDYIYRQGLYNTFSLEADYFQASVTDTIQKLTKDYLPGGQSTAAFPELKFYFKRDMRDHAAYPLDGYYCDFSINEYGLNLPLNNTPFNLLYFQSSFHKYWPISPRFYYEAEVEGKVSQDGTQPYYLQRALGYSNSFVRGYELYVVDGNDYALVKNEIKFRIFNVPAQSLPLFGIHQFDKTFYALYLTAFSDWGYVGAPNPNTTNNFLANTPLWGNGIGLDFVTYYDLVLRAEYSFNKLGQSGFFLHFLAPM
jgi:outer membrane protein assembly factor BamA